MNNQDRHTFAGTIGTGIIGYGASARIFHAPLLHADPGFRVLGFCERSTCKGASAWPGTTTWSSLEDMLAAPGLDLVVICTPNSTHYPLAKACLLAGKHVVVEKPYSTTVAEAEELAALAREKNLVLSVFHNRRWDGDYLTVKSILKEQPLGRVVEARLAFERWAPAIRTKAWKEDGSEGNLLLDDLGSHLVDQALGLFGFPREVLCWMDRQRDDSRVEDSFGLVMKCGDVRVSLGAGMLCRTPAPRFVLQGTRGSFVKYGLDPQESQLGAGLLPSDPSCGQDDPALYGTLDMVEESRPDGARKIQTLKGNYPTFYRMLHDCITQGGANPVRPEEALQVMQVLEAARRSARTGTTIRF